MENLKDQIIGILKQKAIRTQVLGDNRLHSLIVDDDFNGVADALLPLFDGLQDEISSLAVHLESYRA